MNTIEDMQNQINLMHKNLCEEIEENEELKRQIDFKNNSIDKLMISLEEKDLEIKKLKLNS